MQAGYLHQIPSLNQKLLEVMCGVIHGVVRIPYLKRKKRNSLMSGKLLAKEKRSRTSTSPQSIWTILSPCLKGWVLIYGKKSLN